jgi:hypothetical protein
MKHNKKTAAIIIAVIIVIIGTIIFLNNRPEAYFSKVKFNDNNHVINRTNMKYADTIILAGLHALDITDVNVLILPIDISQPDNIIFEAYIIPVKEDPPFKEKKYLIRTKDFSRIQALEILSHELIHLYQFYTLKLTDNGRFIIWDNKVYENIPDYFDRPWEIEAFRNQTELKNKIETLLYK